MYPETSHHWSQQVTESSNALDLEPGVFTWDDPRKIALSLKRSADHSQRRKVLEKAKDELRELYGKSRIQS